MTEHQTSADIKRTIDENVEANCQFLRDRSALGLIKYGCPTTAISLLESIQHAKEETGDLLNYLAQAQRLINTFMAEKQQMKRTIEWFMQNTECLKEFPDEVRTTMKLMEDMNKEGAKT